MIPKEYLDWFEEEVAVMAWQDDAACLGCGPDLFFPPRGTQTPVEPLEVCRRCPVRVECLEVALAGRESVRYGVWGGTTGRERRDRSRARSIALLGRPEWIVGFKAGDS